MSETPIKIPDIGDFDEVEVIEILVTEGDQVSAEDPLLTLESDKATMDIPAPASGTISQIHISVGDRVSEGSLVMDLSVGEEDASQPETQKAPSEKTEKSADIPEQSQEEAPKEPDQKSASAQLDPFFRW